MLYFEKRIHCQPRINGPAVVFLHAFPLNSAMWEPQAEELYQRGIPYLTLDYPGFGLSPPLDEPPAMGTLAKEVFKLLNATGVTKAVLVGLSMGGYLALAMLRLHPDRIHGLILANTRAAADSEEGRRRRFGLIEQLHYDNSLDGLIELHLNKFFTEETRENNPALVHEVKQIMQANSVTGCIHALEAMAGREDSYGLLRTADFPVLVIAGDRDEFVAPKECEEMVKALPEGKLKVIPNCAHLSNIERSEQFNQMVGSYLEALKLF